MNQPNPQEAIQRAAKAVIAEKTQPRPIFGAGQLTGQVTIHQEGGPLPPPETLKKYNDAVIDGAERIMRMAERDQKHFHRIQNASYALAFLGEILGWSIVVLAMVGAFVLVMRDKKLEGAFSFFAGLGLLAAGYYERKKAREYSSPPSVPKA